MPVIIIMTILSIKQRHSAALYLCWLSILLVSCSSMPGISPDTQLNTNATVDHESLANNASLTVTLQYINAATPFPVRLEGTRLYAKTLGKWENRPDHEIWVDASFDLLDVSTKTGWRAGVSKLAQAHGPGYFGYQWIYLATVGWKLTDPSQVVIGYSHDAITMSNPDSYIVALPVNGDASTAQNVAAAITHLISLVQDQHQAEFQAREESKNRADQETAAASSDTNSSSTGVDSASDSSSDWQQHQEKIDELKQGIANHEKQAQQDDAYAEQAQAQVQEDESSNASGPGAGWLALGHAVQGAANAGLAVKMRHDAENERRQAQEEREQLAGLGAEQPPVAENNSESIALTRTQTQMIRSGNTIQGALNRQEDNLQALQQAARQESERGRDEENSGGGRTTQEPAATASTSSPEGVSQARGPTLADASGNESQGGSACQGFPTFIMANATTTGAAETVGQYQYLHEQIQYDIPGRYAISGGQVGVYQGADLATALQNIQHGYQGHDMTVESGEGGTTTATAVSSDTATLDVMRGNILVGTAVAISNGSFEQSYHGYTQGAVPSPLALTLTATPSSCQRVPTQTGAGTLQ